MTFLGMVNHLRIQVHHAPLIELPGLDQLAMGRARQEALGNVYYGDSRIKYPSMFWTYFGQNDAYNFGYKRPKLEMFFQWRGSLEHYLNEIDTHYQYVGLGFATNKAGNTFGVETFVGVQP